MHRYVRSLGYSSCTFLAMPLYASAMAGGKPLHHCALRLVRRVTIDVTTCCSIYVSMYEMSTIMLLGGWNEIVPCIALCAPLATRVEAYAEARGYAISAILEFVVACACT